MRWIRAAIVGLVVAVISLVAVTAVQAVLGLGGSASFAQSSVQGSGYFELGLSNVALAGAIAGFVLGFVYEFKRSGQ